AAGSATQLHAMRYVVSAPANLIQRSPLVPALPYDHSCECLLYSPPAEL
ncbi:hypothetical protein Tco_0165592, partial [Tanacetum coccineum]